MSSVSLRAPQLSPVWRRRIYRYRRWIAATLVALAVLLAMSALQPEPPVEQSSGRALPVAGMVAAPITLAESTLASWLQPGDAIDVIATTGNGETSAHSEVIARSVQVLELPTSGAGAFGVSGNSALVVLQVTPDEALALAAAQASAALTVVRTG